VAINLRPWLAEKSQEVHVLHFRCRLYRISRAALYGLSRYQNMLLVRILLVIVFDFCVVALSGIAAWTIWKAHPWARGWAIAASVSFVFMFIRPFLIPMHTILTHYLISLVVGLVGICAFVWPD